MNNWKPVLKIFLLLLANGIVFGAEKIDISAEIKNLHKSDENKKVVAARRLSRSGQPEAIAELRREIKRQKNKKLKARLVEALAESRSTQTVSDLVEIVRTETDSPLRYSAVYTLGYNRDNLAIPVLVEMFLNNKENLGMRLRAAASLVNYAPDEQVYQCFLQGLKEDNPAIRSQAVVSLAQGFGTEKRSLVIPLIREKINDPDPGVAKVAQDYLDILEGKK